MGALFRRWKGHWSHFPSAGLGVAKTKSAPPLPLGTSAGDLKEALMSWRSNTCDSSTKNFREGMQKKLVTYHQVLF